MDSKRWYDPDNPTVDPQITIYNKPPAAEDGSSGYIYGGSGGGGGGGPSSTPKDAAGTNSDGGAGGGKTSGTAVGGQAGATGGNGQAGGPGGKVIEMDRLGIFEPNNYDIAEEDKDPRTTSGGLITIVNQHVTGNNKVTVQGSDGTW